MCTMVLFFVLQVQCNSSFVFFITGLFKSSYAYYYGYNANVTWQEAFLECRERGLRLAVFQTVQEWERAVFHVRQHDVSFDR